MRKLLLISALCGCFYLCGCVGPKYNEYDDKAWLQEQVEKGYITQEEADRIWSEQFGE